MRDARALDHRDGPLELHRRDGELSEQRRPPAQHDRHQLDADLVERAGLQAPPARRCSPTSSWRRPRRATSSSRCLPFRLWTQGETRDEALANAKEAIGAYLDALEELGKPLPKPSREHITISA